MNRATQALMGLGLSLVAGGPLMAQTRFRLADPLTVSGNGQGWNVNSGTGALKFEIPVASVQGEIPIPLVYRYNASYDLDKLLTPKGIYNPDGSFTQTGWNTKYKGNPIWGTLHFGYIATSATTSGMTTSEGVVLEDGSQFMAEDWTTFSNAGLGSTLSLPQAFGFAARATNTVSVDSGATHLYYTTTSPADLGTKQTQVQGLTPTGFGTLSTTYRVVADKGLARVFIYLPDFSAWVPVLWVDRYGNYVQFQWNKSTASLPSGVSAIYSVKATNQRGQGVQVQWANYTATSTTAQDLVRADFINVASPSIVISGYPGVAALPPAGIGVTGSVPMNTPRIPGSIGRPTAIQVGAPTQVKTCSWQGSGQPMPIVPPADPGPLYQWTFAYDANQAEMTSFTDALGVQSSFVYQTYQIGDPNQGR